MERESSSREIARQRLQQVLVHDRALLSPERMAALKQALLEAAGAYIDVDPVQASMQLVLREETPVLEIKLPVTSIVRERES